MSKRIKIKDFTPDDRNFNRHTKEGMELLGVSIKDVGVIEAITVSSDDVVISGNARRDKMCEILGDDVEPIIIETDGKRPVVLKRTDIDSGTKKFHEAAILANTTAVKNIDLDISLMENIAVDEFDIPIHELGVDVYVAPDPHAEFDKNGEFRYKNEDKAGYKQLIVNFATKEDYVEFARITGLNLTDKTRSTFFPQQEKETIPDVYE